MKKSIIYLLALGLCSTANAGFNGLTIHSRANCGNNESISWDWTKSRMLNTATIHRKHHHIQHAYGTGWEWQWRSAAVCWGEGRGKWHVIGQHYMANEKTGHTIYLGVTNAWDCSIYDGWWDRN